MKQIVLSAGIFILLICITACTPQTKSEHIPLVSGHRGANMIAPENTMASADSCIKYGIDYMECDVCISKDSVFYILHDLYALFGITLIISICLSIFDHQSLWNLSGSK